VITNQPVFISLIVIMEAAGNCIDQVADHSTYIYIRVYTIFYMVFRIEYFYTEVYTSLLIDLFLFCYK